MFKKFLSVFLFGILFSEIVFATPYVMTIRNGQLSILLEGALSASQNPNVIKSKQKSTLQVSGTELSCSSWGKTTSCSITTEFSRSLPVVFEKQLYDVMKNYASKNQFSGLRTSTGAGFEDVTFEEAGSDEFSIDGITTDAGYIQCRYQPTTLNPALAYHCKYFIYQDLSQNSAQDVFSQSVLANNMDKVSAVVLADITSDGYALEAPTVFGSLNFDGSYRIVGTYAKAGESTYYRVSFFGNVDERLNVQGTTQIKVEMKGLSH